MTQRKDAKTQRRREPLSHSPFYIPYSGFLFLLLALALFFWPVWLAGYRFPIGGGDLWGQLQPVWSYTAQWIRRGVFPLWDTHLMAGDPIIAEPQYGLLNPLNWWLFLLAPVPDAAVLLRGVLPLYLAGSGLYLYLRKSPVWRLSAPAALVGGVAYMLADPFIVHLAHPQINDALAWLPWGLLAIDWVLTGKHPFLLASLPLAMLGVAGHYQTALYTSVAIALYAAWRLFNQLLKGLRRNVEPAASHPTPHSVFRIPYSVFLIPTFKLLLVGFVALGLAMPTILPSLERYPFTERAMLQVQPVRGYQWPAGMAVDLLAPWFHGRGVEGYWGPWARVEGGYVGAAALFLALLGFAASLRRGRTWFVMGLGALALLFALGYAGPIYPPLARIDLVIRMGKTARSIYLFSFAVAIGAALGIEALRSARLPRLRIAWMALLTLGAGLFWWRAPAWIAAVPAGEPAASALAGLRLAALLAGAVALLALASRRWARWPVAALLLLLLAEHVVTGSMAEVEIVRPNEDPHAAAIAYLRADPGWFRVDVDGRARGLWSPAAVQAAGFESPQGSGNPMELTYYTQFYWAVPYKGAPSYQLFSVKYIVVPNDALPGGEGIWPVFTDDPLIDIHLNTNAMNRIWLVYQTEPVASIEEATAFIFREAFEPAQIATVQDGPALRDEGSGALEVLAYGPNRARFGVRTSETALLVLSDMIYPGWKATLDGAATPLYTANGIFRGVVVPPGEHVVELRFFPASLGWGLSLAAVAGAALLIDMGWRGRRLLPRKEAAS